MKLAIEHLEQTLRTGSRALAEAESAAVSLRDQLRGAEEQAVLLRQRNKEITEALSLLRGPAPVATIPDKPKLSLKRTG